MRDRLSVSRVRCDLYNNSNYRTIRGGHERTRSLPHTRHIIARANTIGIHSLGSRAYTSGLYPHPQLSFSLGFSHHTLTHTYSSLARCRTHTLLKVPLAIVLAYSTFFLSSPCISLLPLISYHLHRVKALPPHRLRARLPEEDLLRVPRALLAIIDMRRLELPLLKPLPIEHPEERMRADLAACGAA